MISQVKKNDLQNIVTHVKVNNRKEFQSCFEKIWNECTETVIMLLADSPITKKQKAKIIWIATYIPDRARSQLDSFASDVIRNVINDGEVTNISMSTNTSVNEIIYDETSESVPFKLVDVANGAAFNILRKNGLIYESSDEEYGFDDI